MQEDNIVPGEGPHANSASTEEFPWVLFQYPTLADHANWLREQVLAGKIGFSGNGGAPLGKIICGNPRPVEDVRTDLRATMGGFEQEVRDYYAEILELRPFIGPRGAAAPGTGIGKTEETLRMYIRLFEDKAITGTIVHAAKTLDLAYETLRRFRAMSDIPAMVWAGRGAPLPNSNPQDGLKMCAMPKRLKMTSDAEQSIETTCCRKDIYEDGEAVETILCPAYHACAFQAQHAEAKQARLVIVPHKRLAYAPPRMPGGPKKTKSIKDIQLLGIDEDLAGSMIDSQPQHINLDALHPSGVKCYHISGEDTGSSAPEASGELQGYRARLLNGLALFGPEDRNKALSLDKLKAAGLTMRDCELAINLERARIPWTSIDPMDSDEEREKSLGEYRLACKVYPAIQLWERLLAAFEQGRDVGDIRLVETDGRLSLRIQSRSPIREDWRRGGRTPILYLDATMQEPIASALFERMPAPEPMQALMPHATIKRYEKAPHTLGALLGQDKDERARKLEEKEFKRELLRLRHFILGRATQYRGKGRDGIDVLVIVQLDVQIALEALGLPQGVEVAHFNAIAGIDRWGGVANAIIVGRIVVPSHEQELLASALDGMPRDPLDPPRKGHRGGGYVGWHEPKDSPLKCNALVVHKDYSCHEVSVNFHPDPLVNAFAWRSTEGELMQAVGRVRAVNRTAANPVHIDILSDVALPIPIDATDTWSYRSVMAAHGVILTSNADTAQVFHELFKDAKAVENAKRDRSEDADPEGGSDFTLPRLEEIYKGGEGEMMTKAAYRFKDYGTGKRWRGGAFDTSVIYDPSQWLKGHFGNVTIELIGWAE